MGVLEMPEGYDSRKQVNINAMSKQLEENAGLIRIVSSLAVAALLAGAVWLFYRRFRPRAASR